MGRVTGAQRTGQGPSPDAYSVQARPGTDHHPIPECNFAVNEDPTHTAVIVVRPAAGGAPVDPDSSVQANTPDLWVMFN